MPVCVCVLKHANVCRQVSVCVCVCMFVCFFAHLWPILLYLKPSLFNTRTYTHLYTRAGGWHFAECLGSREKRWHRELRRASSAVSISIIILAISSVEEQIQQHKWQQQWQSTQLSVFLFSLNLLQHTCLFLRFLSFDFVIMSLLLCITQYTDRKLNHFLVWGPVGEKFPFARSNIIITFNIILHIINSLQDNQQMTPRTKKPKVWLQRLYTEASVELLNMQCNQQPQVAQTDASCYGINL